MLSTCLPGSWLGEAEFNLPRDGSIRIPLLGGIIMSFVQHNEWSLKVMNGERSQS